MNVIGHRGCPDHYPENSLAAIRGCAPHVEMVEIDIQRCGSGEIAVFHDETLDRLTDERGLVRDTPFSKLSTLSIGGSDETIPTLDDALKTLPAETGINVEFKHAGMKDDVAPILAEVDQEVIVSSFHTEVTAAFEDEPVPTAHLFREAPVKNLETAVSLGCEYIHPQYELVDSEMVTLAHERRVGVNAWTVPTREAVIDLREAGVDGVIVDSWTTVP